MVRIAKMWHRDAKYAVVVGKMALIGLLEAELPQNFVCKQNKTKRPSICKAQ